MEHRWGRRIPANEPLRIGVFPDAGSIARLRDMSVTGGYFATTLRPPLLSRLKVVIDIKRGSFMRKAEVGAHVVRSDANGIGIEWDDVSPGSISALMALFESPPLSDNAPTLADSAPSRRRLTEDRAAANASTTPAAQPPGADADWVDADWVELLVGRH